MGKTINVFATDTIELRDYHITKFTHGKTNRSVIDSADTAELGKLILGHVENGSEELNAFIDELAKNFNSKLILKEFIFYRGVDVSVKSYITSQKIGPAPHPKGGRYSIEDERCLYLIDNKDFLFDELSSTHVLVQKYNIPVNNFKIADLSPNNRNLHNSLACAFQITESWETASGYNFKNKLKNGDKSKYLVSQLLASYFKKYGWDGLYIPGIHGGRRKHYHNLAIFSSIATQWEQWAEGEYFEYTKDDNLKIVTAQPCLAVDS